MAKDVVAAVAVVVMALVMAMATTGLALLQKYPSVRWLALPTTPFNVINRQVNGLAQKNERRQSPTLVFYLLGNFHFSVVNAWCRTQTGALL